MPRPGILATLVLLALVPASSPLAATGPGKAASVEIAAVGDIAMAPASSGPSAFFDRAVRRELAADATLGNLEGTLSTGGSSKCGPASTDCYAFQAPPSYARTLRAAGFTVLNVANNHALDYGAPGQAQTMAALRSARLRSTGRPGEITVVGDGRTKLAFVGFAPYPWAQNLLDIPAAVKIVRKAARKADVVVVTVHAGAEGSDHQHVRPGPETYLGEPRGNVVAFAHAVVNAGADIVVGHGPHVLRGVEWYHGRPIAYSMGNFLGNGTLSNAGATGVSAILHVTLKADGSWLTGRLVPVRIVAPGVPRLDPARSAWTTVRKLSRADFGRNAMRVSPSGTLVAPAWRTG
jgi:hypothetical protein